MKTETRRWAGILFAAVGALLCVSLPPALAEDNTTTTINGVDVDNNGTNYFVGNTGTNNALQILNGGSLTNVNAGYIGYGVGANNNYVLVSGAGSTWANTNLFVGRQGSFNQLTITNGGKVIDIWSPSSLSNLHPGEGHIGESIGANSNAVVVSGLDSLWNVGSPIHIGNAGSWNSLTVANHGQVYSSNAISFSVSGFYSVSSFSAIGRSSGGNSASVIGVGSVWSNYGPLVIGYSGSSNSLSITSGGQVVGSGPEQTPMPDFVGGLGVGGFIGYSSGMSNNSVLVSGSGSLWTNSYSVYVGVYGSHNSLTIGNGGQAINTSAYIGYNTNGDNNAVVVTGIGSLWHSSDSFYVGKDGSYSRLTIESGGTVTSSNIFVGDSSTSVGNVMTVSGGTLYDTNAP
ncbi:MAG: hypothetical protein WC429_12350, partial [Verrucomicrobiia bacterium]